MKSSIRVTLFAGFAMILLIAIVFVYMRQYNEISAQIEANQHSIVERYLNSVADRVMVDFVEMDSMSEKVIYSLLTSNLIDWKSDDFSQANVMLKNETSALLYYISDLANLNRYEVKLYNSAGKFINLGSYYKIGELEGQPTDVLFWAAPAMELNGAPYITQPYTDEITDGKRVVSLCRAVKNLYIVDKTVVYIDVQVSEDYLFKNIFVDAPEILGENCELTIMNRRGRFLYNDDWTSHTVDDFYEMMDAKSYSRIIDIGGQSAISIMARMSKYGWYVIATIPEADWGQPLRQIADSYVRVGLFVFSMILLAIYITSTIMTQSLVRLNNEMIHLDIEKVSESRYLLTSRSRIREVSNLINVINEMFRKIYVSVKEMYEARIQETQARLQALSLMVDPHFLFNSLAVIKIMAKRNKDQDVVGAVDCLANMMRYLSDQQKKTVTISDELKHVEDYIYLMRLRMPGVTMDIHIPEQMLEVKIPKMVIQPLVENCFKYKNIDEDTHVIISGEISRETWTIEVRDNGAGFSPDAMNRLRDMVFDIDDRNRFPVAKIGGYSLINIYSRLRLIYGQRATLEFGNLDSGGAFVRVGGLIV